MSTNLKNIKGISTIIGVITMITITILTRDVEKGTSTGMRGTIDATSNDATMILFIFVLVFALLFVLKSRSKKRP